MPQRKFCCGADSAAAQFGLAAQLKALGHPVRLEIVRQLAARSRCCTNDFCACLPLAQSTISQHLDLLCQAGIVLYAPDGNRSAYSLNCAALGGLAQGIRALVAVMPMEATGEAAHG